jgi:hypothetical protein
MLRWLLHYRITCFSRCICGNRLSPRRSDATSERLQRARRKCASVSNETKHSFKFKNQACRTAACTRNWRCWRSRVRCDTLSSVANSSTEPAIVVSPPSPTVRFAGVVGFVFAVLQSLCTAVLTISAVRVAIGLTALAAASGIYAPAKGFHQDAIRIPMLIVGSLVAVINLAVLFRVWSLRARASAGWRRRTLSQKEKRSERLQVALAILTLVLVGLEVWTHPMVHRTGPPPVLTPISKSAG